MGSFHETPFSAIQGLLVPDHTVGLTITQEGQKKDESRQKKDKAHPVLTWHLPSREEYSLIIE
jgi:hypothetical protein